MAKVHAAAHGDPGIGSDQAKVHTASRGNPAIWKLLGDCLDEVRRDAGLNLEQLSNELGRDGRTVGKWLNGTERPQIEVVFAIERFQKPLVLAMARRVRALKVTTLIEEVA